ncbi:MAG: 4'-phosphopantetheinyl transferase family protein [Chthoniobacterales bacterium]
MQRLKNGDAVIFLAHPRETTEAEAQQLYDELLSPDEQERTRRFVDAGHRHDHIVARSLVRLGLTNCFSAPARQWCFARDEHERPYVIEPANLPPYQFSLSHTRDLVALLVTFAPAAGLDVESIERTNDLPLVAGRVCSASELAELNERSNASWRDRFFRLWTLKEAFAKARGAGLGLSLASVSFEIDEHENISAQFDPVLNDDPSAWQFAIHKTSPRHVIASALRRTAQRASYKIALREVRVTLADENAGLEIR